MHWACFFSGVSITVTVLRDYGYTALSLILDFGGSTELMGTAERWLEVCALLSVILVTICITTQRRLNQFPCHFLHVRLGH